MSDTQVAERPLPVLRSTGFGLARCGVMGVVFAMLNFEGTHSRWLIFERSSNIFSLDLELSEGVAGAREQVPAT
jgi:hypothetical protein